MNHLCFSASCVSYAFASVHCCLVVSPAGKGLTSWLLLVMFIVFLLLSHVVSWVRCGTWFYQFLIFASFITLYFIQSATNLFFHWTLLKDIIRNIISSNSG